jgi:peptidoglycan/xylan/chitin deacetylase (PgdA/CDA1 family)
MRSLRSRIAPASKAALFHSGALTLLRGVLPSRHVAILRYHAICGDEGYRYADPGICVTPRAFEAHCRYLSTRYAVLPMPEVVARIRDRRPLPNNCVVITFDDGYADNLEAARTLNRHGISATFFITADCLAGGQPFWPAEVRALVPAVRESAFELRVNGATVRIPVESGADRQAAIRTLNKLFKGHPIPVREDLRAQLRHAAGGGGFPNCMLTWAELAEMHRLGMTIGAHTLTHPNLPNAGLEAATREIGGSKARLERELGAEVTMFSYPNGGAERYMTSAVKRAVQEAGFAAAATSRNAFASPASDLYALERVEVEEELDHLVFALEVERFLFRPQPRQGESVPEAPDAPARSS